MKDVENFRANLSLKTSLTLMKDYNLFLVAKIANNLKKFRATLASLKGANKWRTLRILSKSRCFPPLQLFITA